MADTAPDMA